MDRAGPPNTGASPARLDPSGPALRHHPTPVQAMRRAETAGQSGVDGVLPELSSLATRLCPSLALGIISLNN